MAAATTLRFLTVPATAKHTATVIFVHGLGDTGYGVKPIADMFKVDPALAHVKWLLPHSPTRPVTANMGIEMPSWFNIYSFGFNTTEDETGMLESARFINQLIANEIDSGLDPNRIILGGYSQGGTMSILTGLTNERKLAGVFAMSSWLPLRNKLKSLASSSAATVPVFWGHGGIDPLVKAEYSKESADFLVNQLGFARATNGNIKGLDYRVYPELGHSTSSKELEDLKAWLKKAIPGDAK